MNELLKGWRTQIAVYSSVLLSSIDGLREIVVQLTSMLGAQLNEGGAVAVIVGAIVSIKALVTDTIPKLKGELKK